MATVGAVIALALSGCAGTAQAGDAPASEAAASEGAASDITVTHAQGETVVATNPEVVLTLDLASLDIMEALGVEADGVPDSEFPDYLAKYAGDEYPKIGGLKEPDFEAINALAPDLLIIAGRSASFYAELSVIAPTIDLTQEDFYAGVKANTETLGEIFGKEDEALDALDRLDNKVATITEATAGAGTSLTILTTGGKLSAYGPGSRFGWFNDVLGWAPVVEDVEAATHGDPISFEFIAEHNPDWLIVIDRDAAIGTEGAQAARALLDNEVMAPTTAWSNDQILYVDPVLSYLVGGGLTATEMLAD
ncbi:MAG: siderophore ABC transporter substrate-binding protein, partial [Propionibacteriaceae bacterium]|nr:siderophore ABC transporter substrate-binding protein [Propionibacteriaceae bacterium]